MQTADGLAAFIQSLLRRSVTTLTPDRAILLECVFEGEQDPRAAAAMKEKILRFNHCAENMLPLRDGLTHIVMNVSIGNGLPLERGWDVDFQTPLDKAAHSLGLGSLRRDVRFGGDMGGDITIETVVFDSRTAGSETMIKSPLMPDDPGFDRLIADAALAAGDPTMPPVIVGVGISYSEETARLLAEGGLMRPVDGTVDGRKNLWFDRERRILSRINREGSFGQHTAMAVNIVTAGMEPQWAAAPSGYICVLAADCLTSSAKGTFFQNDV